MHTTARPTRLLPRQTRVVHAAGGIRLQVVGGALWVTQPHAVQDLFLGPGDSIDLRQDWVVLGADAGGGGAHPVRPVYSEYRLQPLEVCNRRPDGAGFAWATVGSWVQRLRLLVRGPGKSAVAR